MRLPQLGMDAGFVSDEIALCPSDQPPSRMRVKAVKPGFIGAHSKASGCLAMFAMLAHAQSVTCLSNEARIHFREPATN